MAGTPGEALEFLVEATEAGERNRLEQEALAARAGQVLLSRGGLFIAHHGLVGGRDDAYGSANPGYFLRGATHPIDLRQEADATPNMIGLRHGPNESNRFIELYAGSYEQPDDINIVVAAGWLVRFATDEKQPKMKVKNVAQERVGREHLDAVSEILDFMENRLEEVATPMWRLPRSTRFSRGVMPGVTDTTKVDVKELPVALFA